MNLIFLFGLPGVGKFTVAKELSNLTGYKLFHNHLTVDLVSSIFDFGTKPFVLLREKIWLTTFDYAIKYDVKGMIFTFVFEKTVTPTFLPKLTKLIVKKGSIYFVELKCRQDELKKRVENSSRKKYQKIKTYTFLEKLISDRSIYTPKIAKNLLAIDNTKLSPKATALKICDFFKLPHPQHQRH